MRKSKKLVEGVKTALIILLAALTLYLGAKSGIFSYVYDALPLLSRDGGAAEGAAESAGSYIEAARPIFIAVTNSEGGHFAVKYSDAGVEAVYGRVSVLLAEALGSSGEPEAVSDDAWLAALTSGGVFFDFVNAQPLSAVAAWLGTEIKGGAAEHTARRFCLSDVGGRLCLFYIRERDGLAYRCSTALDYSSLRSRTEEFTPNGARFVFEYGDEYPDVDACTILLESPVALRTLTSRSALQGALSEAELKRAFGMDYASQYPESDGALVLVDSGGATLRMGQDGTLAYRAGTDAAPGEYDELTAFPGVVNAACELAMATMGVGSGDAEVMLSGVSFDAEGGEYTVYFDYFADGVPVRTSEAHAAELRLSGGRLVYAAMSLREYDLTDDSEAVFPEKQAMAMVTADGGGEPLLVYYDGGDGGVEARWVRN